MNSGHFLLQQLQAFSTDWKREVSRQGDFNMAGNMLGPRMAGTNQHINVLKNIAELRARGKSFSSIAASLNEQGLRGRNGARWYSASVREYLRRNS